MHGGGFGGTEAQLRGRRRHPLTSRSESSRRTQSPGHPEPLGICPRLNEERGDTCPVS